VEYFVTMTTHVPTGTPEAEVDAVRAREAAHSRELAAEGKLLRLWRPPLQPGEWRTVGLFAAGDDAELEKVLASMPLRVWRTDDPTPLRPHPNDPRVHPGRGASPPATAGPEFLTTFTVTIPEGAARDRFDDAVAREAQRAHQLAEQGHLLRLWGLPSHRGASRVLGLWRARDREAMQDILTSLPMAAWMTVEVTPLTPHPSDPAARP
jgi:muconolactone delta-isomerase